MSFPLLKKEIKKWEKHHHKKPNQTQPTNQKTHHD